MEFARHAAEAAIEHASKAEKKIEDRLTLLWHELHPWQQDNYFIRSGYRPASNSFKRSAASLGYLHNETVNIYSHLIGAIVAIFGGVVLYHILEPRYETATRNDVFVFSCFFIGAFLCLGMSATFHMISNHSESVASFGNKLDYIGIVFLIWGSFVPSIYYGFSEDVHLVRFYWAMITTIGAGCAVVSISPKFRSPQLRPFRAAMFVAMGLSAVFPIIHGVRLYGLNKLHNTIGLTWLVTQGALYITGAAIYAARIPERFKPGYFDIWGHSHQIFHMFVLSAAIAHLVGLIKAFDYQHSQLASSPYAELFQIPWR